MACSRLTHTLQPPGYARTFNAQARTLCAILLCFVAAPFAEAQSNACVPTREELQQKVDDFEKQKDTVGSALKKEAFNIFDSSYKGLNSATDASLGALLIKSGESDKIQKTIVEAEAASSKAKLALKDAEDAYNSGRRDLEIAKSLEAALAEAEAESKFKDAYKLTGDVFTRAGKLLSGDMSPKELAERFWDSRTDVANALKELSVTGQAMEDHKSLAAPQIAAALKNSRRFIRDLRMTLPVASLEMTDQTGTLPSRLGIVSVRK